MGMSRIKELKFGLKLMFVLLILAVALGIYFFSTNFYTLSNVYTESKVIMDKNVKDGLDAIYLTAEVEIPVCLGGIITADGIIIDEFQETEIIRSNATSARYVSCPSYIGTRKVIGTIHNHNNGVCRLSETDIKTYSGDMKKGQAVIGLYCGKYLYYLLGVIEPEVRDW